MSAAQGLAQLAEGALSSVAVVGTGSAAAEVIAVILGAGIALTIIRLAVARSLERSYTTTPTVVPPRATKPGSNGS